MTSSSAPPNHPPRDIDSQQGKPDSLVPDRSTGRSRGIRKFRRATDVRFGGTERSQEESQRRCTVHGCSRCIGDEVARGACAGRPMHVVSTSMSRRDLNFPTLSAPYRSPAAPGPSAAVVDVSLHRRRRRCSTRSLDATPFHRRPRGPRRAAATCALENVPDRPPTRTCVFPEEQRETQFLSPAISTLAIALSGKLLETVFLRVRRALSRRLALWGGKTSDEALLGTHTLKQSA